MADPDYLLGIERIRAAAHKTVRDEIYPMYRPAYLAMYRSPDPEPVQGGGTSPPPPVSPPPPPKPSQAEIDAAVTARLAEERKKWDDERNAEKEKEQGEFKKLYEREQAARAEDKVAMDKARAEARELKVRDRLRSHVAEHAPEYAKSIDWIMSGVSVNASDTDEQITEKVKAATDKFKADNPISKPAASGTPEPPVSRGRVLTHPLLKDKQIGAPEKDVKPQPFSTLSWRV